MQGDTVYAGARWGSAATRGFYRSTDGGDSWTKGGNGLPDSSEISGIIRRGGVLFGSIGYYNNQIFGGVYRSADNGMTWANASAGLPPNDFVNSVAVKGDSLLACIGALISGPGMIYVSTNNGNAWTPTDTLSRGIIRL